MKEFGIEELIDKYEMCSYDKTDEGTSFVRRHFKKSCLYLDDVWVKWSKRWSV